MTDAQSAQTALDKLIEAVEAGTLQDTPYRGMQMASACYPKDDYGRIIDGKWHDANVIAAYHGNILRAAELHDLLLPKWGWEVRQRANGGGGTAYIFPGTMPQTGRQQAKDTTPARAWLLAILRAYRSLQP